MRTSKHHHKLDENKEGKCSDNRGHRQMRKQGIEILQRIYDSEINLSLGWLWDGGVDYRFSDLTYTDKSMTPFISTCSTDICDAIMEIAEAASKEYQNSEFSKWWEGRKTKNISEFDVEDMESFGRWVSVKDKLPSELKKVIVYINRMNYTPSYIDVAYIKDGEWRSQHSKITHWMPLPDPPAKDSNKE